MYCCLALIILCCCRQNRYSGVSCRPSRCLESSNLNNHYLSTTEVDTGSDCEAEETDIVEAGPDLV